MNYLLKETIYSVPVKICRKPAINGIIKEVSEMKAALNGTRFPYMEPSGKFKRIGRKTGNVVAAMLAVSITAVVAICVVMFYSLVTKLFETQCVDGTKLLAYELRRMSDEETKPPPAKAGGFGLAAEAA